MPKKWKRKAAHLYKDTKLAFCNPKDAKLAKFSVAFSRRRGYNNPN